MSLAKSLRPLVERIYDVVIEMYPELTQQQKEDLTFCTCQQIIELNFYHNFHNEIILPHHVAPANHL